MNWIRIGKWPWYWTFHTHTRLVSLLRPAALGGLIEFSLYFLLALPLPLPFSLPLPLPLLGDYWLRSRVVECKKYPAKMVTLPFPVQFKSLYKLYNRTNKVIMHWELVSDHLCQAFSLFICSAWSHVSPGRERGEDKEMEEISEKAPLSHHPGPMWLAWMRTADLHVENSMSGSFLNQHDFNISASTPWTHQGQG